MQKEQSKAFGPVQEAQITRQLLRVEQYGRTLNGDYFGRVRGSAKRLEELRLRAKDVQVRFLFTIEVPRICLLLACYKEDADGNIPRATIEAAERRLDVWRARKRK